MAEVKINITAQDRATDTLSAVEKGTYSLCKAFDYLKESSLAFKYVEASALANPKFWDHILKIAPYAMEAIRIIWEQLKENQIEKTLKSIEPAVSKIKDFKPLVQELSGAMKNLSDNLNPVKDHFESINRLISEIKANEGLLTEWKKFQAASGANADYSGLEKELSYRTGHQPSSFESLNTGAMRGLYDMAKKPLVLNLNIENFLHNLQTAYDVFRDMRFVFEEPIALTLDVSSALSAISDIVPAGVPKHGGAYYIPSTGLYPLLQGETVLNRKETSLLTNNKTQIAFSPTINLAVPKGADAKSMARELDRELADMWACDRSRLKRIATA